MWKTAMVAAVVCVAVFLLVKHVGFVRGILA